MSDDLKPGEKVTFTIHKRPNPGTIQEKVTEDTELNDQIVHASKKDPQYIIEHDRTGTLFNRHANKIYEREEEREEDDESGKKK